MRDLDPLLGVIYDFNLDELYFGSLEQHAMMNESTISVSKFNKKDQATLVTGIPAKSKYTDDEFNEMISDFQMWKKIRMIGSAAMASVYVASGKAEIYKENGIFLWDIAAGAAITRAAGGKISIENMNAQFRVNAKFTNGLIE
jgi:myo-inositol-1(or 4)-monophosphatase